VAGAIAGSLREHENIAVQTVGAAALNQAIKATTIARNYLERDQLDLICVPTFVEIQVEDKVETAIRLLLTRVPRTPPALTETGSEADPVIS
jgi:stage V sporulation protein S